MKKLLSLLATVTMAVTPVASLVVSCGTSSSDEDKDSTNEILKGSLGSITSKSILEGLADNDEIPETFFGSASESLKTFMNYFAEALLADNDNVFSNAVKANNKNNPNPYLDNGTLDSFKNKWSSLNTSAKDAWDKMIKDAKDGGAKDWESTLLKNMQSQFGKKIYENGKAVTAKSYTQYKSLYINDYVLNNKMDEKSLFKTVYDLIYGFAKKPNSKSITDVINDLSNNIYRTDNNLPAKIKFNFNSKDPKVNHAIYVDNATGDARKNTWFGQMDIFLQYIKDNLSKIDDKDDSTERDAVSFLVQMINISGGLNAETELGIADSNLLPTIEKKNAFTIDKMVWATSKNINQWFAKSDDITKLSNWLIRRLDSTYEADFLNKNVADNTPTDPASLAVNGSFNFSDKIPGIITGPNNTTSDQVLGLFSNAQRYVADQYFANEKPVAVSEITISQLYDKPTVPLSTQITNSPFVGADHDKMNALYDFIGNFINSDYTGTKYSNATAMNKSTGEYSWDVLLNSGSLGKTPDANGNIFNQDFAGKVKVNKPSTLLTASSSSSDFSDLLKYSVYDFLNGGAAGATFAAGGTPTNSTNYVKYASIDNGVKDDETSFNLITSLTEKLSRSSLNAGKMYEVVNPDQGIIAFIDSDGLHFVRIEGYSILKDAKGDKETPINTNDLDSTKAEDATYQSANKTFNAEQTINTMLGDTTNAAYAASIASNPNLPETAPAINQVGVKYSDLNSSFGNKYLQFLANTSIPKINSYTDSKYSYDLNALLTAYSSGDITDENILGDTLPLFVWDYVKELTGWSIKDMFKFTSNSLAGNGKSLTDKSLEFANNLTDEDKQNFATLYENWITTSLSQYGNSKFDQSRNNLAEAWRKADETFGSAKASSANIEKLIPNNTFANGKDDFYTSAADSLSQKPNWKPNEDNSRSLLIDNKGSYKYSISETYIKSALDLSVNEAVIKDGDN